MSVDPDDRSESQETAGDFKCLAEHLAEDEEKIKKLDEGSREAERKSKEVFPDPESYVGD